MSLGRPNELDPALIVWSRQVGDAGTTIGEAAEAVPHTRNGRMTVRALSMAAKRLFDSGILVRKLEYTSLTNGQIIRRFRYWHSEFSAGKV